MTNLLAGEGPRDALEDHRNGREPVPIVLEARRGVDCDVSNGSPATGSMRASTTS
jgi:hypothetical protein